VLYRREIMKRIAGIITFIMVVLIKPVQSQQIDYINASLFDDGIRDVILSEDWIFGLAWHSFQIFSLTGSEIPEPIAGIPFPGHLVRMDISGGYAYIANYDLGLHIVDISNPANPVQLGRFVTIKPTAISAQGNYVYLTNSNDYSLEIIDVSNPYNPIITGVYYFPYGSSRSEDIAVQDGYAFVADSANGLQIINVSDPAVPFLQGSTGIEYVPTSIFVEGGFAYVVSYAGYGNSAFEIFDISDPSSPSLSGTYLDIISKYTDLSVSGNYAFVTNRWEMFTMRIFDVSNPSNPTIYSTFIYGGWGAHSISLEDTLACLGNIRPVTLTVVDISYLLGPTAIGYYSAIGDIRDIFVIGDYGYVAADEPSLLSLSLLDPSSPEIVGSIDRIEIPDKIFIRDTLLYLANNYQGLEIFDISDPGNILFISQYYTYRTVSVDVEGDYAYLANFNRGIEIVDISNPLAPVQAGFYDEYAGRFYDVAVAGNYAFVACGPDSGFRILDVSNPADPVMIGGHNIPADARAIDISGQYAFAAAGPAGTLIFDISDLTNPVLVSQIDTPNLAKDVVAESNYMYVADTSSGLSIYDIQNISSPELSAAYNSAGQMLNIYLKGNYIYAADRYSLLILYFDRETGTIERITDYPVNYLIPDNYPNPFNSSTTLKFNLPEDAEVVIDFYDILGRRVDTLSPGKQTAGPRTFVWNPKNLTSGVYFYRITAGNYSQSRGCILLK